MGEKTVVITSSTDVKMEEMQEEQIEAEIQEVAQEAPQEISESQSDRDWKAAREVMSAQKREMEELRAAVAHLSQARAPQPEPELDEFEGQDPDDYLTVGKAREMAKKLAAREGKQEAKKLVDEYIQQQKIEFDEQRARGKYEDYDYVLENYALPLIKSDPALAYKIQTSKTPAETAYRIGKLSDSYEESNGKTTNPRAEKILKNSSRPVSSHASNTSLKAQADSYAKMTPSQVWEESQKYANRAH
jgi:hypothetical protein